MDESGFHKSLKESINLFMEVDLTEWGNVSRLTSHRPSDEFRRISLRSGGKYVDLYKVGMRNKDYNFVLADYSFLQFSLIGGVVRYGYYPCPYMNDDKFENVYAMQGNTQFDENDYVSQLFDELDPVLSAPPVRYDVSPKDYKECTHPYSHMHIGAIQNTRIPVDKVMTPLAFSLFIVKQFYFDYWMSGTEEGMHNKLDIKMAEEKRRCTKLKGNEFTDMERALIHIN